jgi:hypothetical protein
LPVFRWRSHLFPDYPELEIAAWAPETVSPEQHGDKAILLLVSESGPAASGLRDRLRLLRGNIGDRFNKIRAVARIRHDLRILNHIQKIALGVDLSGFLKL